MIMSGLSYACAFKRALDPVETVRLVVRCDGGDHDGMMDKANCSRRVHDSPGNLGNIVKIANDAPARGGRGSITESVLPCVVHAHHVGELDRSPRQDLNVRGEIICQRVMENGVSSLHDVKLRTLWGFEPSRHVKCSELGIQWSCMRHTKHTHFRLKLLCANQSNVAKCMALQCKIP